MKNVTLIGDSIRMGYQQYVVQDLDGIARIWGPEANGGDSNKVRAHLSEWVDANPGDIVHLNCGLHDLRKAFDSDQAQVDPETYRANLIHIFDAVVAAGRKLIWATTTPVNEDWHHERKGFDRFCADVDLYNTIALEEARRRDLPVTDLHALVTEAGRDELLVPDGVHFSDAGSALLGKAVAASIVEQWKDA